MDLKAFYRKIHELELAIASPYVVVIGIETPDGGKAGNPAEVSRLIAAKLITEGRVRLASDEETKAFHELQAANRAEAEALAATQRMMVTLVPSSDLRAKHRTTKD
jgi:hypothetical protein